MYISYAFSITVHCCPNCKSYSGDTFEITKKDQVIEEEEVRCTKCGWEGKWSDTFKDEGVQMHE